MVAVEKVAKGRWSSISFLPDISTVGTLLLVLLLLQPLVDAVHVKHVPALALNRCAIISAVLALVAGQLELSQANGALEVI